VPTVRAAWAIVGISAFVVAGCTSGSTSSKSATTIPGSGQVNSTTVPGASSSSTTQVATSGVTTTSLSGTGNLPVTDAVRQSLLEAGAAHQNLPASDYTGLRPGETYYAYDAATSTYWAGAALAPSPASQQAQVASQDDGSYLLFEMPNGGSWTAYSDGLGGIGGTPCPVTIPPAILQLWGWSPGGCQPPNR
jgi:hypothetical protein